MNARKVLPELKKQGFLEVAVLDGGVQGWQAAALPLVK
jgi:rhodanese-related sulfurtransferase